MSGPSATAKPMSAKISTHSSKTWLTGWMRPIGDRAEPNRQRDVGALGREPLRQRRAFQRGLARFERLA